ncbi:MAG: hypothetical protein V3U16_02075 [Candidatus Neomarinimicrobiota bacterium]
MNCYHLKDWLINDTGFKVDRQEVEDYVTSHMELSLCADISNCLKHFALTKDSRSKLTPEFDSQGVTIQLVHGEIPTTYMRFTIKTKDNEIRDAFELATKCVELWKDFIEVCEKL